MSKRRIILLAVLAVLALLVFMVSRWIWPYDLDAERAAARAAGAPLSAADFPQTPIPDARNSVIEYTALYDLLKQSPLDPNTAVYQQDVVPRAQTEALRRELGSRPDIAALVHRAASKPELFRRHTWSPDEKFPYYAVMRSAAKWIRAESLVMARDGHYTEAVRHQAAGFAIARQAGLDPPLFACLVSASIERITLEGLEDILHQAGPKADVADAVHSAVNAYRPTYDLTRSLRAEMMMGLTAIAEGRESAAESYAQKHGGPPRITPFADKYWMRPNEAVYIHWMTGKIVASRRPEPERLAALKRNDEDMNKVLWRGRVNNPAADLAAVLLPVSSIADARALQAASRREVVASAAAVLAYKARHGSYPATLDLAVSPTPVDPMTVRPLVYRVTGHGFKLAAQPDTSGLDPAKARSLIESLRFAYPEEQGQ